MIEATTCRSCHAPIYMLRNQRTGNTAPVEVATSPRGNIRILDADGEVCYQIVPAAERYQFGPLHLNHYVTCPQSPGWHQYAKGGRH